MIEGETLAQFILSQLERGSKDALDIWLACGKRADLYEIYELLDTLVEEGAIARLGSEPLKEVIECLEQ